MPTKPAAIEKQSKLPIAVIGDTHHTSWMERTFLRRERNEAERELLLRHLFQADFDLLIHLGDMVGNGASALAWQEFDRLFAPAFSKGIPFLPLMGNHEYWGNHRKMLFHFSARFPELDKHRWHARVYRKLGLILLDSNIALYSKTEWAAQIGWFNRTLQEMSENPQVRAILVFSHHPPFTNSAIIKGAPYLESGFLPAFFASPKAAAFISGHVHGYERFASNGKVFIVSGGGGGPRLRLHQGRRRRHHDQFQSPGPRPFNYLLLHPESEKLHIEVMGLKKGEAQIHLVDAVEIPQH